MMADRTARGETTGPENELAAIEIEDLVVSYGRKRAVEGLSLAVEVHRRSGGGLGDCVSLLDGSRRLLGPQRPHPAATRQFGCRRGAAPGRAVAVQHEGVLTANPG